MDFGRKNIVVILQCKGDVKAVIFYYVKIIIYLSIFEKKLII